MQWHVQDPYNLVRTHKWENTTITEVLPKEFGEALPHTAPAAWDPPAAGRSQGPELLL